MLLLLVYKSLNNQGSQYIEDFLHAHSITTHPLGSCDQGLLKVPKTNFYETFGDDAIAHSGPFLWNKLPLEIRYSSSVAVFIKIKVQDTPHQASIQTVIIFVIFYRLIVNRFNIFFKFNHSVKCFRLYNFSAIEM